MKFRAQNAALGLIHLYKVVVSPWLSPACRFSPTCSDYASEAIGRYGFLKGCWLAALRLCRCQPLHPGGFDPLV